MEYLLVNFFAVIVPFVFTFHKKLRFDKKWVSFAWGLVFVAIPFVVWDVIFTNIAIWGFNPDYLTGLYLFALPIEEVLFFICVPYSCLFTYHCFSIFWEGKQFKFLNSLGIFLVMILCFLAATLNMEKLYTFTTALFLLVALVVLKFIRKVDWLGRFLAVYLVLLIPFSLVNGVLTGSFIESPIVWYNDSHNVGVRLGTIPVEDVFYGFLLILLYVSIYEWTSKNSREA